LAAVFIATTLFVFFLPSILLLLRQRRVAAGKSLVTGLGTKVEYVQRTARGTAGNGLGTMIKYLRRTRNGLSGNGLGTTIKYLYVAAGKGLGIGLGIAIKYVRRTSSGAAGNGLGTTAK
jgi:hypothetical protein